eukprot:403354322
MQQNNQQNLNNKRDSVGSQLNQETKNIFSQQNITSQYLLDGQDDIDYKTALSDDKRYKSRGQKSYQDPNETEDYEELKDDIDRINIVTSATYGMGSGKSKNKNKYSQLQKNDEEDLHFQFLDANKKKSSSEGSNEEGTEIEQAIYFQNEEKVIKNHLKLNIGFQVVHIVLFILAIMIFDWTHLSVKNSQSSNESPQLKNYHISLMKIETDSEYKEPSEWLYSVLENCIAQEGNDYKTEPQEICERAGSLFLAGAFVFIKYLIYVYIFFIVLYFLVSMSFIYLTDIGVGLYLSLLGVVIALLTRQHFLKLNRKIQHLQLVKTLVVEA